MSLPPPRENEMLLGHRDAEAAMLAALRSGRMHHAWLITGPEGIGKATLAYRFARRLLAGLHEGEDLALPASNPVFRRVAAGTHADLLTIEREFDEKRKRMRGEIVVDTIRKVPIFLHLTPAEGGWRVVVIDGAEHMNRNAANALLKMLEEPPPRAILLLACATPGRLLPTIRSRCRTLGLQPLADDLMEQLLRGALPSSTRAERVELIALSEGSPGRALLLAEGSGVELARKAQEILDRLPRVDLAAGLELADQLAVTDGPYGNFMDLLRHALATDVRQAARGESSRLASLRSPEEWVEVWQALSRLQGETEGLNLDKRQALIQALTILSGP
jgi:DNA polymerase-3 subunit delta'